MNGNPDIGPIEAGDSAIPVRENFQQTEELKGKCIRRPKVVVKNLTRRFGELLVLDNISFSVGEGEFLCIVGPTGCGKTTFLNCLSKLIPTTQGNIFIDGAVADPRRHNISFVFQEPTAMPWRTVAEGRERSPGFPESANT